VNGKLSLVFCVILLAGCLGSSEHNARQTTTDSAGSTAQLVHGKGVCPLTIANGRTPSRRNNSGMNHGNGKLWTALWPHNVVIATPDQIEPDGAIGMKWPWYRGVRGRLQIEGRRLDGKAPPVSADIPSYGNSGFQPSGIYFPTQGCWEITGRVGTAELTFVTVVLKASAYGLEQARG
jgi:hypothetical protein